MGRFPIAVFAVGLCAGLVFGLNPAAACDNRYPGGCVAPAPQQQEQQPQAETAAAAQPLALQAPRREGSVRRSARRKTSARRSSKSEQRAAQKQKKKAEPQAEAAAPLPPEMPEELADMRDAAPARPSEPELTKSIEGFAGSAPVARTLPGAVPPPLPETGDLTRQASPMAQPLAPAPYAVAGEPPAAEAPVAAPAETANAVPAQQPAAAAPAPAPAPTVELAAATPPEEGGATWLRNLFLTIGGALTAASALRMIVGA